MVGDEAHEALPDRARGAEDRDLPPPHFAGSLTHLDAFERGFGRAADALRAALASPWALVVAVLVAIGWFTLAEGLGLPRQQLDLHFLMTLVTFLLVFFLQRATGRDTAAVNAKLDELLTAMREAEGRTVGAEKLDMTEVEEVRQGGAARR
ncbi:MAG: low affinity iron permease family protein [Candidatus Limnocylindria bacterium]